MGVPPVTPLLSHYSSLEIENRNIPLSALRELIG